MNHLDFKNEQIKKYAHTGGWVKVFHKPEIDLFSFYSSEFRCHINIWAKSMRVVTCMKHPASGYTCLIREGIGIIDLKGIFSNPRTHTHKGRRLD